MSTDRVQSRLRVVKNDGFSGDRASQRVRRLQLEADRLRELEAEFRREQQARIRMECLAQRKGAAGWEIEAARYGGAA